MIQIGGGLPPVSGEPLEHLVACHDRILDRLRTLERVGDRILEEPVAALDALASALRFMETSGKLHTVDEEESVFPRMRQRLTDAGREYLDALESEHRDKEQVYADLLGVAAELRQEITPERVERYRTLVSRLAAMYRSHIESENTMLVSLGRDCLAPADLEAIHAEMKARRR